MKVSEQEKYKVKCIISTSRHEKVCYPYKGTLKQCRELIYYIGIISFTAYRREGFQYFYGLSRFDDSGLMFLTLNKTKNLQLRVKLFYEIVTINKKPKNHD